MSSLSSIVSKSGQYENIIQQLVQLESKKKFQLNADLNSQNKINTELGRLSSNISSLENILDEYSNPSNNTFSQIKANSSDETIVEVSSTSTLTNADEYSITIDRLAKKDNLLSANYSSTGTDLHTSGTVDITVNGTTHTVSITPANGDTNSTVLNNLKSAIETAFGETLQVNVFDLDSTNIQLSVRSSKTGYAERVQISNATGSLSTVFDNATRPVATNELDASFTLNGVNFQRSKNIIDDTISGVTLDLKKTTTSDIKINLDYDITKNKSQFQDFMDSYNTLNKELRNYTSFNGKTGKSGVLRELRPVKDLSMDIRQKVILSADSLESTITNMTELGVVFDNDGNMKVDNQEIFDNIFETNPDALNTFFSVSSSPMKGLMDHLNTYTSTSGIIDSLEDSVDSKIENINNRITRENKYLSDYEEKQREIFTNLETIMEQGQAQYSQVMASLNNM
jgi:flagellar hook-associated protein 2